jgi:hypothetical protein
MDNRKTVAKANEANCVLQHRKETHFKTVLPFQNLFCTKVQVFLLILSF